MTASSIREIIEQGNFAFYGLRSDARILSVGEYVGNSHQLFQDPEYDEDGNLVYPEGEGYYEDYYDAGELDGTCAILIDEDDDIEARIEAVKNAYGYYGGNLYLIAGDSCQDGYDRGEGIIEDAVVVAIV